MVLFSGSVGTLWLRVLEVRVVSNPRAIINPENWRLFVPWVNSYEDALAVYDDMDDGSGYVFFRLEQPYEWANIGPPCPISC